MHRSRQTALLFVLACLLWVPGAYGATPQNAPDAEAPSHKVEHNIVWYRLHFGQGTGPSALSREALRDFIDTRLTPEFPQGFTMTEAFGRWESPGGLIREETIVVDVQCQDTDDNWQRLQKLITLYVDSNSKARASCFIMRIPGITTTLIYSPQPGATLPAQ